MTKNKEKQNIPEGWGKQNLLSCFDVPAKLAGAKQSEYEADGNYPVFDQGQDYVSGYSKRTDLVVHKTPAILFGDHTRIIKYIETPFVPGADGTKIFWAKEGIVPEFIYYVLLNTKIPNTGYNRHFKFLKDVVVTIPNDQKEQQKIAEILGAVDEDIAKTREVITVTEKLKRGLMQQLFTRGIPSFAKATDGKGHRKFKQTEIGEVPEVWEVVALSKVASVERGKFSHRPRNDPAFFGGDIPFIQTAEVVNCGGVITKYTQTLNKTGLSVSRMFPKGTIVLTIAANIGETGILDFDSCFPDSLVGIVPMHGVDAVFLEYFLRTRKDYLNSIATQSAQKNINLQKLEPMLIAKPTFEEQLEIANILSGMDKKIIVNKKLLAKLIELKKGLMQDLLSGRRRVSK